MSTLYLESYLSFDTGSFGFVKTTLTPWMDKFGSEQKIVSSVQDAAKNIKQLVQKKNVLCARVQKEYIEKNATFLQWMSPRNGLVAKFRAAQRPKIF